MRFSSLNFVCVPKAYKVSAAILTRNVISDIVYFRKVILESSWNVS